MTKVKQPIKSKKYFLKQQLKSLVVEVIIMYKFGLRIQ